MKFRTIGLLCMALLVLPLFTASAGAIYLEGQAPPDDTSVNLLAASSGPAEGDVTAAAIPAEAAEGDVILLFHASIAYPAVESMELPAVPVLSGSIGSVPGDRVRLLPWIASSRYWEMPGIRSV